MPANFLRPTGLMVAIALLFAYVGCTKQEQLKTVRQAATEEISSCRLMAWYGTSNRLRSGGHTSELTYNSDGDPIRLIRSDYTNGTNNSIFRYDTLHRLSDKIDYGASYANGATFREWHHYYYDSLGRVYMDSVYYGGPIGDSLTTYLWTSWTYFSYDSSNRLIKKEVWSPFHAKWKVFEYTYGSDQNLSQKIDSIFETSPVTVYVNNYSYNTNSININRASTTFQFLSGDYSLHSQDSIWTINAVGLPTILSVKNNSMINFLETDYSKIEIAYDCH